MGLGEVWVSCGMRCGLAVGLGEVWISCGIR